MVFIFVLIFIVYLPAAFLAAQDNSFIAFQDFDFNHLSDIGSHQEKNVSVTCGYEFTTHAKALGRYFSPRGSHIFSAGQRRGDFSDIPKINMVATEYLPVEISLLPRRSVKSIYVQAHGFHTSSKISLGLGLSLKEIKHELNPSIRSIQDNVDDAIRFSDYLKGTFDQPPPHGNSPQAFLENNKLYQRDKRAVGVDFLDLFLHIKPSSLLLIDLGIRLPGHRRQSSVEWLFSPLFSCQVPSAYANITFLGASLFGWDLFPQAHVSLQSSFHERRVLGDAEHLWSWYQLLAKDQQNTDHEAFVPAANIFTVPCKIETRFSSAFSLGLSRELPSAYVFKMIFTSKFFEQETISPDFNCFKQENFAFVDTVGYAAGGGAPLFGNNAADFDGGIAGSWIRPSSFVPQKTIDKASFINEIGFSLVNPQFFGTNIEIGFLADFDFYGYTKNKMGFFVAFYKFF